MLTRILTTLLLACALPAAGAAAAAPHDAPALALNVERVEDAGGAGFYRIDSTATVAATPATAWRILTDYDRLAEFVPDLTSVRVLSRDGDTVVVEQLGRASFLFFSRAIHLVVQVHEQPQQQIDTTLVDGDMKVYRCRWTLTALPGGGTRVQYHAAIEPKFYVPGIVGTNLVRKDIAKMMAAVLLRIERGAG
jgi:ribosome-associated toxin RatA of RatAB toxin-antitoxin module